MQDKNEWLPASVICTRYSVSSSFISDLGDHGLIEVHVVEEQPCISSDRLGELEKLIHFHYDLDINMEGMEAIAHLLDRVEHLQRELIELRQIKSRLQEPAFIDYDD